MKIFTIPGLFVCLILGLSSQAFTETLSLEQVIKEVSTNSDSVKMMKQTIIKSEQTIKQNWARALPTLSATVSTAEAHGIGVGFGAASGKSNQGITIDPSQMGETVTYGALANMMSGMFSGIMVPSNATIYGYKIVASQPIYTFGKVGTAIKVAGQYDASVRQTYTRNIQQLQLTGLDAFYSVVLSQMALSISERSLNRKKELYDFLNRNFALGSGSKAQILATLVDVKNQETDLVRVRQVLSTAKLQLCALLGRPLTDSIDLDTSSEISGLMSSSIPTESDAVQTALAQRGDLRSLSFLKDATLGGAKIYKSMYYPTIAAQGAFGPNATDIKELVKWDNRNWSVGVALNWTIFDGFANSAISKQYVSDAKKLEIAQGVFSKQIQIEISQALSEITAADSNLIASKEGLSAAQESYDLTNENFKQGSGQFVEVEQADERLSQAEMGLMNARYRAIRSRAALTVAMGRDIVKMEEK